MCLGVPGQIVSLEANPQGVLMGQVRFGGISKDICLALLDEANAGDWVIVHAGFAISRIDEKEAAATLEALRQLGEAAKAEDDAVR